MSEQLILRLLDGAFLLFQAHLNRQQIVDKVREKLAAGASAEEIADMLQDGRLKSEIEAQRAIDQARAESPK